MALIKRALRKTTVIWSRLQPRYRVNGLTIPGQAENVGLIFWQPNWKSQIIARVLKHRPGLFIDVGVNVGQTLLDYHAAPLRNGYLGFEPNPRCVQRVDDIISASQVADCEIVPAGLADQSGVISLYVNPQDKTDACATVVKDLRPGFITQAIYVPAFRFDDESDKIVKGRFISLVKIDVEGGELGVITGMAQTLRDQKPWIICEVLHRAPSADPDVQRASNAELMRALTAVNYKVFRIEKDEGEREIAGFTPMDEFPNWIFEREKNGHLCDYLFVPDGTDPQTLAK